MSINWVANKKIDTVYVNSLLESSVRSNQFTNGVSIGLREIVEGLVDGGYYTVSRDTVRSYVMSVLRDEVVGRRGAVKTVGGLMMR